MRISVAVFSMFIAFLACSAVSAQTLSQTLSAEQFSDLASAAQQKGDAVRGAILFTQKNLNCAGCHQPAALNPLGPDLTLMGPEVKGEYLVESLLQPSKVIKQGYESVKIATISGQVTIGRVIEDLPEELVLRESTGAFRKMRIAKSEIEQIAPNTVSTMPANIVDQLQDRQQFLDLIRYLMEIAATGQQTMTPQLASGGEPTDRIKGLALIDQFGCVNCHRGDIGSMFPAARAPDLTLAGLGPDYIRTFLADPQHVKPGVKMPSVMTNLDVDARNSTMDAIGQYLSSQNTSSRTSDSSTNERYERRAIERDSADRGKELYDSIGCVACHSPVDEHGSEVLADQSVLLGDLAAKYSHGSLTAFLENPHATRPSGRMPNMSLSHWEAVDLASYLLIHQTNQSNSPAATAATAASEDLVELGRMRFVELRCVNCHEPDNKQNHALAQPLDELSEALGTDRGCLSLDPARSVQFAMTETQRSEIAAALEQISHKLEAVEQIQLTMHTFRCFACHQRGKLGGVADERDGYFISENENLGPQGRIPPTLTNVGAKLDSKWLRQVLVEGRSIRPYMKTRMPQYGAANVAHLVELFAAADELAELPQGHFTDAKEARKAGTDLVGQSGLNCIACHSFQQKPAQTMPGLDLTDMGERLQRTWFEHYMRQPQKLSPGTVMPSFWPGGKAIRPEILEGNTEQQIAAIWTYLLEGRQAPVPRGLVQKPIELLAGEEAVMLRRSYPGIGKRGIGVGFPGGVNLAFDAEQMRLAMVWRGMFAETSSVWRGQGSGMVRPLSREVIHFGKGPDLDDSADRWNADVGRPPRHQFTGYILDDLRRPKFTYRFGEVEVEDYFINAENEDGSGLKRAISFSTLQPREGLEFVAASGESLERIDEHHFLLNGTLHIKIDSRHAAKISPSTESLRLLIPLKLDSGRSSLEIEYKW